MNTQHKNRFKPAMTRVEILAIICVATIGIFLAVHYQKTGELFHVSWGKKKTENNQPAATEPRSVVPGFIQPVEQSSPQATEIPEPQDPSLLLLSTNVHSTSTNEAGDSAIVKVLLDNARKQRVQVPPNAIWKTNGIRRGSGVIIAFP